MGWKNGVQYCQRNVEVALEEVRHLARGYVDDILIGTNRDHLGDTEEDLIRQHFRPIRSVLLQLGTYDLIASRKKAQFFVKEVEFCGHLLAGGKRHPAKGKLTAVQKWEKPATITGLRAFLGFANYYSGSVKDYAGAVGPMMDLLKVGKWEGRKGSVFRVQWTPEADPAFLATKEALGRKLSLQTVRQARHFVLRTDASGEAIGAVLEQVPAHLECGPLLKDVIQTGTTAPVTFLSRKLTESQERTWDVRDKEAYAIVSTLDKWSGWIGLQPVLALTDHKALEHWTTEILGASSGISGRRARWH